MTQSTQFTAIGYEHPGFAYSSTNLLGDFTVRYDATAQAYYIDVPSAPESRFAVDHEDPNFWYGVLDLNTNIQILKPDNVQLDFVYTTFGDYYHYDFGASFDGAFAFGQATPAAAVPVTGSATYEALILGRSGDSWSYTVNGTASLQFNFGAGTLTGYLEPTLIGGMNPTPLGRYDFVNTVYSVGSTTFSGGLQHSTPSLSGSFNGLFTGPAAQELMARWTAQYLDQSGDTKGMYGVLVGKKP